MRVNISKYLFKVPVFIGNLSLLSSTGVRLQSWRAAVLQVLDVSLLQLPDSDEWITISWSSRSELVCLRLIHLNQVLNQGTIKDLQDSSPPGLELDTSDLQPVSQSSGSC